MKYLLFEELEAKPKTKQFAVKNTSGLNFGLCEMVCPVEAVLLFHRLF